MNRTNELAFQIRVSRDLVGQLDVGDLMGRTMMRRAPVCRKEASLWEVVKVLEDLPGARNVYVIDEHERLLGEVSLPSLGEILLFDYQPSKFFLRLIPAITARCTEDVMEPVDVAVREDQSLDEVLRKLVPAREQQCPVVDDAGRVIGCLTLVDILGQATSSNE